MVYASEYTLWDRKVQKKLGGLFGFWGYGMAQFSLWFSLMLRVVEVSVIRNCTVQLMVMFADVRILWVSIIGDCAVQFVCSSMISVWIMEPVAYRMGGCR